MSEFMKIKLSVDTENLEESLFKIYKKLRPNAEKSKTLFKELKGGYVNLLYVLYSENDIQNALVFRTFGIKFKAEMFFQSDKKHSNDQSSNIKCLDNEKNSENCYFDRISEALLMNCANNYGLCKPVYAIYLNGMCFGYAQGDTVNGTLMLKNDFLEEMSTKLAKFHFIETTNQTLSYDIIEKFFEPSSLHSLNLMLNEMKQKKEFQYNEFPDINELIKEKDYLKLKIDEIGFGEIAFCHNDLNQKNLIWNSEETKLYFIDFESAMNNYIAYEIGQLFFSFSGHISNDFDEKLLPSDNYCLKFIRRYLEEKYKLKNQKPVEEIFEKEVEKLFIRSNICLLMSMIKAIIMGVFLELKTDIFQEESNKHKDKFFFGNFGLKIWKSYLNSKNNLLKPLDNYLKHENFN